ncbi:hypothetical protein Q3G72_018383 [Acer saccharum]|nr:hypothetical protein Q3G72_018383 [Acer saccharum]
MEMAPSCENNRFGFDVDDDVEMLVMVWCSEFGVVDNGVLCSRFCFDVNDGVQGLGLMLLMMFWFGVDDDF